jgi:hypothetical protein
MGGTYNELIIEAGADSPFGLLWKENGVGVNVTGWDISCPVADARTGAFLFEGTVETPSSPTGTINITFPASVTDALPSTPCVYEVFAILPSGQKIFVIRKSTATLIGSVADE